MSGRWRFTSSFLPRRRTSVELAPRATVITAPTGWEVPEERWSGGGDYFSWVGRYDPTHKGLDMLTEAVAALPPERRPRIVLRGYDYKGGQRAVRQMVADRGLGAWMRVDDVVLGEEKTAFLATARGYVHPSRWESYGLALAENLALGVPCLVSSAVSMSSELRRHNAALLAAPETAEFAKGLLELGEGTLTGMESAPGPSSGRSSRGIVALRRIYPNCTAWAWGEGMTFSP